LKIISCKTNIAATPVNRRWNNESDESVGDGY
jgi:hypothetical protein